QNSRTIECAYHVEKPAVANVQSLLGATTMTFRRGFSASDDGYTFLDLPEEPMDFRFRISRQTRAD
ncbi:unnamed protein product, partial [Amoebophrya sp. A25]